MIGQRFLREPFLRNGVCDFFLCVQRGTVLQHVRAIRLPERPAADRAALRAIRAGLASQVELLKLTQQAPTGIATEHTTSSTAPTAVTEPSTTAQVASGTALGVPNAM